jgi:phasin family protein
MLRTAPVVVQCTKILDICGFEADKYQAFQRFFLVCACVIALCQGPQESSMSAAEAAKSTVDQFAAASNVAFKDGIEKTLAAFNEANAHSKKNLEAVVASVTAAAKGAETLGSQAMALSKKTFDDQVAAARSLAGAKSVQEVVELQTSFARTFLESYVSEMSKLTETVSASVRESMKPLNERVTDLVERMQATR